MAGAAMVNGGVYRQPTLIKRAPGQIVLEKQRVLAYQYSHKMRSRAAYTDEYKRALQILASDEGCMFLARALANS